MKIVIFAAALALTGCATERFGREQHVTAAEKTALTCEQIDLEIAKVDGFLTDVDQQWSDTKGRRFLGFVGDLGIGNRSEHNDAIESADARRDQLVELRTQKKCAGVPPARPDVD